LITLFRSLFAPPRHLILVLAALWIGLALAEHRAERHKVSRDALSSLVYYALIGYVIGGRLFHALANFRVFVQSPWSLVSLNLDLFDPLAGLAVALLASWMYGYRKKLGLWQTLDALTPVFACIAVGLSLSHLAAGTAFGSPTSLPWGIELWGAIRHPSQVYELGASLLVFSLIWFRRAGSPPGTTFLIFVALSAAERLFFEGFRGDSTIIAGGYRLEQVIAWFILAVLPFLAERIRAKHRNEPVMGSRDASSVS
jgi:phosphatidylglycerol:prolipoprotein diacylglycerol transferase